MTRGSRLRILLGACIVGGIGVFADSKVLISASVLLLIFSCVRYRQTPPTNFTEKFGPVDPDDSGEEGFGALLVKRQGESVDHPSDLSDPADRSVDPSDQSNP